MRGSGIHSSYLSLSYILCHVYGLMLQFIAWWLIISPSGITFIVCLTASISMGFKFHGIVSLPFSPHELTVCSVVFLFGSTSLTLKLVSPTQICFSPESIVATQMLIQVIKTRPPDLIVTVFGQSPPDSSESGWRMPYDFTTQKRIKMVDEWLISSHWFLHCLFAS